MGAGKGDQRYFRAYPRRGLVRPAAGSLQADTQHQERHHRRGAGRDAGLLRHDTFGSHGRRDPHRQDAAGGAEHRPGVRRDQHGDERALSADRVRRSQSAFSDDGLPIGAGLEDLGKGTRSQVGTIYATKAKGPRYLDLAEGYIAEVGLDEEDNIIGYKYINIGKMMDAIKAGTDPLEAIEKASGTYGRFDEAVKKIDPRQE